MWQSHKLPSDDLCSENAIILSRFHKYPLIIDPSGQAQEYIESLYKTKKISRTSFAEENFMKTLESALRFGCPLLVQDVEKIDPILNSVLNKELHRTGGRVLIRVGDQDIDFADSFLMYINRQLRAKRFIIQASYSLYIFIFLYLYIFIFLYLYIFISLYFYIFIYLYI